MKTKLLYFILGAVLFTGIGVYAGSQINASQIYYTDSNNNEITVDTALNNLYTTQNTTVSSLNNQITNLENAKETTGDVASNHLGLGPVTSAEISVTPNAYYIITLWYKNGITISLSNAKIIHQIRNAYHTFGLDVGGESTNFGYTTYYVYTTDSTITVTANSSTRLSYSKIRLFQ